MQFMHSVLNQLCTSEEETTVLETLLDVNGHKISV